MASSMFRDEVTQRDPYETNPSGNLLKGIDLSRLQRAARSDLESLQRFRDQLTEIVRQYVGSYYGAGGVPYEVPLPLITQYVTIHSRALVAKNPKVDMRTHSVKSAPAVDAMQNWMNEWFEEIELGDTLRQVVIDALFCEGHLKVCLAAPEVAEMGYGVKAGQPLISPIQEHDFICDMSSSRQYDWDYCGHSYEIPLEVAHSILDRRKKKLVPTEETDDISGTEKLFRIGAGSRASRDILEPKVRLWEIYIPRKNVVLTIRDDHGLPGSNKEDVLRVIKWIGPKCGPIHTLGFYKPPGNLRYLPPLSLLLPLHLAINRTYRKIIDTADDYKEILPVRGGAMSKDGKAIKAARHKEIIAADNADTMRPVRFNVPPTELQLFCSDMRQAFDHLGGGLAVLGGQQAMTKTATQEKILNQNAGMGQSDMQESTVSFAAKALKSVNWYLWNHPENVYETEKKIQGLNEPLERQLYPYNEESEAHQELIDAQELMRQGPMPFIRVDPFSIAHTTPGERLAFITQALNMMAPYAAISAQNGDILDTGHYLELMAKFGDEPEIRKLYKKMEKTPEQMEEGGGGGGEPAGMAPETTRNYNRTSSGNASPEAQQADMRSKLMSMSTQNGQPQPG